MSTGPHGFVPVEIGRLRKATEAWMAARLSRIAAEREEMVRQVMAETQRRWSWRRMRFERYSLTRDEAIASLKVPELGWWSLWDEPTVQGSRDAEHIGEVGLSVRHIRHVHHWVYLSTRTVALLHKHLTDPS